MGLLQPWAPNRNVLEWFKQFFPAAMFWVGKSKLNAPAITITLKEQGKKNYIVDLKKFFLIN